MNFVPDIQTSGATGVEGRVCVVGAGVGGMAAAIRLAAAGLKVTVVERQPTPGGKLREVPVGTAKVDSGPTVLTMRHVFDELAASAGKSLEAYLTLNPLSILARHAWEDGGRLDLFADVDQATEAIGAFAGARDAQGYRDFCERARQVFAALDTPFMQAPRPSLYALMAQAARTRSMDLLRISPFATLWGEMGKYFGDPRLRQLFARYATYCGSSPFRAPATLMLVAHVEQAGVWTIEGGMYRLAEALRSMAADLGVDFLFGREVEEIRVEGGQVTGVALQGGEVISAGAVVTNADVAAVSTGLLGTPARKAVPPMRASKRSLSALTWSIQADVDGFPLAHHTVFFCRDYQAEFDDIFRRRQLPVEPTIYVCAQDRTGEPMRAPDGAERLFCIVNAPAEGDHDRPDSLEIEQCQQNAFRLMERCGLRINPEGAAVEMTTPVTFNHLFPATGGALYGMASHGWRASFQRPGVRTRIPGLYLAGGSVHPGPGLPMAALSGRLAADCLISDLVSTRKFHPVGTCGGMSTP